MAPIRNTGQYISDGPRRFYAIHPGYGHSAIGDLLARQFSLAALLCRDSHGRN
jgi:hypothetical protein